MDDFKNNLPMPRTYYISLGHIGPTIDFEKLVKGCSCFSLPDLKEIALNKSLDLPVRETAVFMIGAQWTQESLEEVYKILKSCKDLTLNIENLLEVYNTDFAKEIAKKLESEGLITPEKAELICRRIDAHIKYGGDPARAWSYPIFKN